MDRAPLTELFKKLETRDQLSDAERLALQQAAGEIRRYPAGSDLVVEGSEPTASTLLVDGMASRYNLTESGKRQITAVHVPGDFVDLHSFPLKRMDHSVGALTNCVVVAFPHAGLERLTENFPHLTRMLWMLTLIDGALHRRWLVSMGRTFAESHLAHFLCEIYLRLEVVGRAGGHRMKLPVTQQELGDILGVSAVHANRTVQALRADHLIEWTGPDVRMLDWDRLVDVGQFEPSFLYFERRPR